jgi:hypothetical protein
MTNSSRPQRVRVPWRVVASSHYADATVTTYIKVAALARRVEGCEAGVAYLASILPISRSSVERALTQLGRPAPDDDVVELTSTRRTLPGGRGHTAVRPWPAWSPPWKRPGGSAWTGAPGSAAATSTPCTTSPSSSSISLLILMTDRVITLVRDPSRQRKTTRLTHPSPPVAPSAVGEVPVVNLWTTPRRRYPPRCAAGTPGPS